MLRIQSRFDEALEALVKEVVDCGFAVHTGLGPGFREKDLRTGFLPRTPFTGNTVRV